MRTDPPRLRPASLAVLALLSACGGGGSGGAGPSGSGPGLNQGSYSIDDFDYVDEHPAGFHPLGVERFQLYRDELLTIFPSRDGLGRSFDLQEDPAAGHAAIPGFAALFPGPDVPFGAAAGQLDDDPDRELVVATLDPARSRIQLHCVERSFAGVYTRTPIVTLPATGWSIADVRVTLGNVDDDDASEIVVVARSARFNASATFGQVWVLDDPAAGGQELLSFTRSGGHIDLQGLPIDVDGDSRQEIAVGLSGDTTDSGRYAVSLFGLQPGAATMTPVHGWVYLYRENDQDSSRAVVGDFDQDGREDLAWVGSQRTSWTTTMVRLFEYGGGSSWSQYAELATIDVGAAAPFQPGEWAVTAFHPAMGRTDLAFAYPESATEYDYTALHYERELGRMSRVTGSLPRKTGGQGIRLVASDVDADGVEEVQVGLLHYASGGGELLRAYLEHVDGRVEVHWQAPRGLPAGTGGASQVPVPVLVPGDLDSDGFAIQPTGRRFPRLADPIPIVVLSAPPTVPGISQNYDDTGSRYSTSETQGTTAGVTTYASVTTSASVGIDLFGMLGVEGRASLERGVERTSTHTSQETLVRSYSGPFDQDVIVFQGTLYEAYEYVIVAASDPAGIGQLMTLDIPHKSLTYKWTVDYYDQQVAPEDRIGPEVLTHTAGDVRSYPTRNELRALMDGEMHWDYAGEVPVGQSGSSTGQSVSFAQQDASEEQRTIVRGYGGGASFGIGPVGVGAGIDFTSSEGATHAVFFERATSFEANVGDISDPADYEAYRYSWGFSIQTVGRRAAGDNAPDGYTGRKHSFQYLRYWVDRNGTAF